MASFRVHEFAKENGLSNKILIKTLFDGGFGAKTHMSCLSDNELVFLKSKFGLIKKNSS